MPRVASHRPKKKKKRETKIVFKVLTRENKRIGMERNGYLKVF